MPLIILVDVCIAFTLIWIAQRRGREAVLPAAAMMLLLFPSSAVLRLPGLFDLTVQRVIVLLLLGITLFTKGTERGEANSKIPLRYLLGVLLGWMMLSSAKSIVPVISFKATLSAYLDFFVIYIIYVRGIRTRDQFDDVLSAIVLGTTLCSVFGVIEIYTGWNVSSLFPPASTRFMLTDQEDYRGARVRASFDHAILFGSMLVMACPMVLYLLSRVTTKRRQYALWLSLLLMLFCLYRTNSRGAWLAGLLSLTLLVVGGGAKIRRMIVVLTLLISALLILRPGIRDTVVSLYMATKDPDSPQGESYQWRYVLYRIAREHLSTSFGRALWGFGPESFYYLGITTDFTLDGVVKEVKVESCDSAIVELMMDTGYVGCGLVVAIIAAGCARGMAQYRRAATSDRVAYLSLTVDLAAFAFMMTNVQLFGWGQQTYIFWIILALIMGVKTEAPVCNPSAAQRAQWITSPVQQGQLLRPRQTF